MASVCCLESWYRRRSKDSLPKKGETSNRTFERTGAAMEKLTQTKAFEERQNIVLEGFDPIAAGGFTQVPNLLLNDPSLSFPAKIVYAKLLSYAWHNNRVFPGEERMAEDLGTSQSTVSRALG